jgi:hypothetical protein
MQGWAVSYAGRGRKASFMGSATAAWNTSMCDCAIASLTLTATASGVLSTPPDRSATLARFSTGSGVTRLPVDACIRGPSAGTFSQLGGTLLASPRRILRLSSWPAPIEGADYTYILVRMGYG